MNTLLEVLVLMICVIGCIEFTILGWLAATCGLFTSILYIVLACMMSVVPMLIENYLERD